MQMNYGPDVGFVGLGAMDVVVDRQEVGRRQLICPFDQKPLATPRLDRRTWRGRSKAPKLRGLHIAMHFAYDLPHRELIVRKLGSWIYRTWAIPAASHDFGNRKRIHKLCQQGGIDQWPHVRRLSGATAL